MRILSVDWDYFIDADITLRSTCFPDGGVWGQELEMFIWSQYYASSSESLMNIGTSNIPDFNRWVNKYAKNLKATFICNAHEHCYAFVKKYLKPRDTLELTNIDFHHDLYQHCIDKLNSGNWLYFLMQENPKGKFGWVSRKTSSLYGEPPQFKIQRINLRSALSVSYDYLFICKSGLWSPPHLDTEFKDVILNVQEHTNLYCESGILDNRFELMQGYIEQNKQLIQRIRK